MTRLWSRRDTLALASVCAAAPLISPAAGKPAEDKDIAMRHARLAGVGPWGCQFQNIEPTRIIQSDLDLIVIDTSLGDRLATAKDIAAMKRHPAGKERIVIAYLSVGEAETYRSYWQPEWLRNPPAWLAKENPRWEGNYVVQFWDRAWQDILYGSDGAMFDGIIAAGFDGVFLDRVDVAMEWEGDFPDAPRQMSRLVKDLARYARRRRPEFIVIGQNAEPLLALPDYLSAIDAVSKECLLYGLSRDGVANKPDDIAWSLKRLRRARAKRPLPVFAIEYLDQDDAIADARQRLTEWGFKPFIANRALDRLPPDGR